ncbi:MAG: hypothetical protein WC779_06485 [Candidatus Omnitrophota bacterium]|jgi:hypothetical protein
MRIEPKRLLHRVIFFIGWLLSPLTLWNDVLVNIPLSYLFANILIRFIRVDFLFLVLILYWLSNGLGLLMMWASGRAIIRDRAHLIKEALNLVLAILVYSIIIILLNQFGILKPIDKIPPFR